MQVLRVVAPHKPAENNKMEMRMESYVFYRSFHDATKDLTDEQYGKIMRIINEYSLNGIEPNIGDDTVVKMAFLLVKPQIDANSRRRENGNKGGRPRKRTMKAPVKEETVEPAESDIDMPEADKAETVAEDAGDNAMKETEPKGAESPQQGKSRRFQKPTLEELQAYINERNFSFSAERFIDYYDSKGWLVGKSPMKNWRAACSTWERNAQNFSPHPSVARENENLSEFESYFEERREV